ncbi:MAG: hypothetical protein NTY65_12730 [Planctomycetota bacterium]|nr:hypothetical protein [Planctomycetota bacterium]
MRARFVAVACLLAAALVGRAGAESLDLKRYMPVSEVQAGMTGIGKTTLQGTDIVEFQVRVLAVLKNAGPKNDMVVVRCSGAGLEESGVIAGMSGSPVYIGGRMIGAIAYAFQWGKLPLAGVQPIEQMLAVSDDKSWAVRGASQAIDVAHGGGMPAAGHGTSRTRARGAGGRSAESSVSDLRFKITDIRSENADTRSAGEGAAAGVSVPASTLGLGDLPGAPAGRTAFDLQPIQTPVMVSGLSPRALDRFRKDLEPFGMVPMMSGGFDPTRPVKARLEPGAPLVVSLMRGDVEANGMGTITEVAGDRLYGFGHAMFGFGEADYPLMTGVAQVVVPSLMRSFRIGAPAAEVGRLVWDEQTAVFGRLTKERSAMVPISVKVVGPAKGAVRTYHYEMIRNPKLSPALAGMATGNSLVVQSDLPRDHTVAYRVTVKPVGRPAVVRENLACSPNADGYLEYQVRTMLMLAMDNPYFSLPIESVEVEATIEPESHQAEIQEVRALRNSVRPGGTMPVEMKVRPYRSEPRWLRVEVHVPDDYAEGSYRLTLCGADEALRSEMREAPARFRPDDMDSLLAILGRNERRDQLFVRLEAPGDGLAIGRDELPNLPPSMRTILGESARRQTSDIAQPRVSRQTVPYVLQGSGDVTITVDRHAPEL